MKEFCVLNILVLLLAGYAAGSIGCPQADLNGDCEITFADYSVFAGQWLKAGIYYESGGMVVMEAEGYSTIAGGSGSAADAYWNFQNDGTFSGSGYMRNLPDIGRTIVSPNIQTESPRLSYTVFFATTGDYYLWLESRGNVLDCRRIHYGLDGSAISGTINDCALLSTSSTAPWRSQTFTSPFRPKINVSTAGLHTIDIWMCEDGARVDRLLLTTSSGYTPTTVTSNSTNTPAYDFDGNGKVDLGDLNVLVVHWLEKGIPCDANQTYVLATDYDSINDAVAMARCIGAREVFIPAGDYTVTAPIDLTGIDGQSAGFVISGSGASSVIKGNTGVYPVFDLTGSNRIEIKGLTIEGINASAGVLIAKSGTGNIAGRHILKDIRTTGNYSLASIYIAGAGENSILNSTVTNSAAGGFAAAISPGNPLGIQSSYRSITSGTCSGETMEGSSFEANAAGVSAAVVIDSNQSAVQTEAIRISNCAITIPNSSVEAGIVLDGRGGLGIKNVEIVGCLLNVPGARFGVCAKGGVKSVEISNNEFVSKREMEDSVALKYQSLGGAAKWWKVCQNTFRLCGGAYGLSSGGKYIADFENLSSSDIELGDAEFASSVPQDKRYYASYLHVGQSTGNSIRLNAAKVKTGSSTYGDAFTFDVTPARTIVDTLSDPNETSGLRRRYLGIGSGDVILNLKPQNVAAIVSPKKGDIAMDDGSNTADHKPALAYFNGSAWKTLE